MCSLVPDYEAAERGAGGSAVLCGQRSSPARKSRVQAAVAHRGALHQLDGHQPRTIQLRRRGLIRHVHAFVLLSIQMLFERRLVLRMRSERREN